MAPPVAAGVPTPTVSDPHVERLRAMQLQTWQLAYCRDVVKSVAPSTIKGVRLAPGTIMVGRAYTVSGPEIYLDALEGIGPGEVYIQANCSRTDSVFSPGWTHAYLAPRGAVGCIVDGAVYKSFECDKAAVPMFAAFYSPSVAINRAHTGTGVKGQADSSIGLPLTVGPHPGVTVKHGDIVCGDEDGVIVIPQEHEDELMKLLDGYLEGNGAFGRIAAKHVIAKGVCMTEHEATADMFALKYKNPNGYWREYAGWWKKWRLKYPDVANESAGGGATAFYSGKQKTEDAAPSALSPLIGAALAGALAGAAAAILVARRR